MPLIQWFIADILTAIKLNIPLMIAGFVALSFGRLLYKAVRNG